VANNGDIVDEDDEVSEETEPIDPKMVKEIETLNKMADDSGAAKVMLRELEKKKSEVLVIDPRSASRTPSAKKEPIFGTRYESPVYACECSYYRFLNVVLWEDGCLQVLSPRHFLWILPVLPFIHVGINNCKLMGQIIIDCVNASCMNVFKNKVDIHVYTIVVLVVDLLH